MRIVPVTVVIPVQNGERWLERALGTVARQTVQPDEVIAVDDGSSDDSVAIAKAHGVTVLEPRNRGGVSAARNIGIREARNPWIALLDQDDVWDFRKLERQWQAIESAPECRFSFTDLYLFDKNGLMEARSYWLRRNYASIPKRRAGDFWIYPRTSFAPYVGEHEFVLPSTMMVERRLALELGGFDEHLQWLEDREFTDRIVMHTDCIVVEEPLTGYYHHEAMGSNRHFRNNRDEARMAEIVLEKPQRYHPAIVAKYRRELPLLLVKWGKSQYVAGQTEDAAETFARSFRLKPTRSAAVGWLASQAGRFPAVRRASYASYRALRSALGGLGRITTGR